MLITGKKCPWCGAGLNLFQLLMDVTPWDMHEISYEKHFPCSRCKKPIVRRNNRATAKKTARQVAVIFAIPLLTWLLIHHYFRIAGIMLAVLIALSVWLCYVIFDLLTLYAAVELEKEEKLP